MGIESFDVYAAGGSGAQQPVWDETVRIVPVDSEYVAPAQRSDAQKVMDTILEQVAEDAAIVVERAESALSMLAVVDREGAARFSNLSHQARKLVEHVAELKRLR
jgi:hypothetical protein